MLCVRVHERYACVRCVYVCGVCVCMCMCMWCMCMCVVCVVCVCLCVCVLEMIMNCHIVDFCTDIRQSSIRE